MAYNRSGNHGFLGHETRERPINVRKTVREHRRNPCAEALDLIAPDRSFLIQDEAVRFEEAYHRYWLSLRRFLEEMSIAIRYQRGPYWTRRVRRKYTPRENLLAARYHRIKEYLELDLVNCVVHARTVLDRACALTRPLFKTGPSPSFTSFNRHRQFFIKGAGSELRDSYSGYVRMETDWFAVPLKLVRDKFLVHQGPKHMKILGYPGPGHELGMVFTAHPSKEGFKDYDGMAVILSIPQLADDVRDYLSILNTSLIAVPS